MMDLNLFDFFHRTDYEPLGDDLKGVAQNVSFFFNESINSEKESPNVFNNLTAESKKPLVKLLSLDVPGREECDNVKEMYRNINSQDVGLLKKLFFNTVSFFSKIQGDFEKVRYINNEKLIDYCVEFYKRYLEDLVPVEASVLADVEKRSYSAIKNFLNVVYDSMNENVRPVFCLLSFGVHRVSGKLYREVTYDYMRFLYSSAICSVLSVESMDGVFVTFMDSLKTASIEKFQDFYDLWLGITDKGIIELFNTKEYCSALSKRTNDYNKFIACAKKVYEKTMFTTPFVMESDVRDLYKTVYKMQQEIDVLKQKLEKYEG